MLEQKDFSDIATGSFRLFIIKGQVEGLEEDSQVYDLTQEIDTCSTQGNHNTNSSKQNQDKRLWSQMIYGCETTDR